MRVLTAAVAISAALHGVAIAWVQTRPAPDPEPAPAVTIVEVIPAPAPPPAPAPEPDPMTVALLDDHTVATLQREASRMRNTARPSRIASTAQPRIEAAATGTTILTPEPQTDPGKPRHPMMTMRKPELDKGPSTDFTERFLANSKPLAPKDIPTEQLADELGAVEGNLKNPRWIANATPDQVTGARMALAAKRYELGSRELQPDGTGTKSEHETFRIKVAADGSAKIHDKANLQRKGLVSGSFDVTDALMRSKGQDPYSSYKLKVLDETRAERVAIGKRQRTQQLAQSKAHAQNHLARLWATTADLGARKQGLFELWDDCAETGSDELIAGGRAAREHVVGFIRSKLPATGPEAFTAEELTRFNNQRRSRAPFAPY